MALPKLEYDIINDSKLLDDINNAFIKKFKTDKNFYIYDVNTNEFLKVDEVVWGVFPNDGTRKNNISRSIKKWGEEKVSKALSEIKDQMVKDRLFSSNRPKICMTLTKDELEKHIKHKNEQTILNVTEDCNFRCKYCIYSGIYKHIRTHSKKYMTWETAKAAMDDFIINSSEVEDPAFSFYGGEPMLAMDLIKQCVAYLKEKKKKCHFNITTNGSLLDEEQIRYFIDNNFSISISLNGPKEIHDAYRVYASGKGSWDDIMNNIELINSIDSDYFKRKVGFTCTFTPPYNIKNTLLFFKNKFPKIRIAFSKVDIVGTNYFRTIFPEEVLFKDYNNQVQSLFREYIKLFLKETEFSDYTWLLAGIFESFPSVLHRRPICFLPELFFPQGQCFFGVRRLFVNSDGYYFPCERVNDQFNIGDCKGRIDIDKIYNYITNFFNVHTEKCFECAYIRLCRKCMKSSYINDIFYNSLLDEQCSSSKRSIPFDMKLYMEIVEKNPDSLLKVDKLLIK